MSQKIASPTRIPGVGNLPKIIDEFVGRVNSGHDQVSVARMQSPEGWQEPGQRPDFDEITFVLEGMVQAETEAETHQVRANEVFFAAKGDWVRYSTPEPGGATYIAICVPGFSPDSVHRDQ